MKTLKKGDKGQDVVVLQRLLVQAGYNLGCDGKFWEKTENAVKDFQKSKQLTADGIVGDKTWGLLQQTPKQASTDSKCVDSSVIYNPLKVHVSKLSNRDIKYLAIHYTAGRTSEAGTANATKKVFEKRSASADFCVDNNAMVQFNPDLKNYYCWAVGDKKANTGGGSLYGKATNRNTISIEICSSLKKGYSGHYPNHDGWYFTQEALDNAEKLTKILMKKYNIPIERVVRHYDISGKPCPGLVGWNDYKVVDNDGNKIGNNNSNEWVKFKERLGKV